MAFESDDAGRETRGGTARVRRVWPLLPARVCRDAGAAPSRRADTILEAARKTGEEFAVPVCGDIHTLAEHGVHFFNLFHMWFGPGRVVAAQQSERPAAGIIDQVHCTVRYSSVLLANFYHGFHQSSRMESQEARIVCERGTIRLFEWVPTRIDVARQIVSWGWRQISS